MPVFFLPPDRATPPTLSITGDLLTHLRDSLRIEVGERILLADGQDRRFLTEITAVTKQTITGQVIETLYRPPRQAPALILGQALLKGEKMDWVIQKATELGAQQIVPIQSKQSIVQIKADRIEGQLARWQRIALEAAQQSEQWQIPTIAAPRPLASCRTGPPALSLTLLLTERREQINSLAKIALPSSSDLSILVLVGPEGGWAREEIAEAEQAGAMLITLGSKILRAETAAMTTIAILQHRLGELG
jgi:16S rRNA (uracil1498-N3)-methyltransferase